EGGDVVASGSVDDVMRARRSVTGHYLAGRRRIERGSSPRPPAERNLVLRGARHHNLRGVDARFPLGRLVCVTGVSGSGKSSLVIDTLLPALRRELSGSREPVGMHEGLDGVGALDKVVAIDQRPIGRTPRSNAATYTGIFTLVRELFAGVPDARMRGYKPGRFSFNLQRRDPARALQRQKHRRSAGHEH
ncbi:MAG: hypothetical protein JRH20_26595, partial [Deltaproteobacteria bacterium]|nr:hypothetical protein [Deltaproteobacteria bacterium]